MEVLFDIQPEPLAERIELKDRLALVGDGARITYWVSENFL
jgi:hypothetical protein